jgi:hypothetical protein
MDATGNDLVKAHSLLNVHAFAKLACQRWKRKARARVMARENSRAGASEGSMAAAARESEEMLADEEELAKLVAKTRSTQRSQVTFGADEEQGYDKNSSPAMVRRTGSNAKSAKAEEEVLAETEATQRNAVRVEP